MSQPTVSRDIYYIQTQIQKRNKNGYGYDGTMSDVEDFIIKVESLPDRVDNLSLKKEKTSLIHAAKQFPGNNKENKKSYSAARDSLITTLFLISSYSCIILI
jgi:hypothetical protein